MSLQESLNGMAFSPPPTLLSFSEMGFGVVWIGLKLPSQLKRSLDWWCSCKTLISTSIQHLSSGATGVHHLIGQGRAGGQRQSSMLARQASCWLSCIVSPTLLSVKASVFCFYPYAIVYICVLVEARMKCKCFSGHFLPWFFRHGLSLLTGN